MMDDIFDREAARGIGGAHLGDTLAKELRVVFLDFQGGSVAEHIVHEREVDAIVAASIRLHYDPGMNPHNGETAARIWRIRCADFRARGPYWWTERELGILPSEGAFTISAGFGRTIWIDEDYARKIQAA